MSGDVDVARRVEQVSAVLYAHAGGIVLDHIDHDGRVHVAFTGACTGCPYRPVTMATTIRPGLMAIEGVSGVEATGSRISEEAERRLAEDLDDWWRLDASSLLDDAG
jgi:Fe-S cluster biogenesis protein NfuA